MISLREGCCSFSGPKNLRNRFHALFLILCTRTFPANSQVGPSSTSAILNNDAEHSRFALMDDYTGHETSILAASTVSMLMLKNVKYLLIDAVFGWDQVDVYK